MSAQVPNITEYQSILRNIVDGYSILVKEGKISLLSYSGSIVSEVSKEDFDSLKRTRMISIRIKEEGKEIWY